MAPRTALALVNSNTPRRQTQTQLQPSTKKNGTLTKKAPPTKTNDQSHILVSAVSLSSPNLSRINNTTTTNPKSFDLSSVQFESGQSEFGEDADPFGFDVAERLAKQLARKPPSSKASNLPQNQNQNQLNKIHHSPPRSSSSSVSSASTDSSPRAPGQALFAKYKPFADPKTRSKSNVTVKKRKVVENEEEEVENVDGAVDDTPIVSRKKKLAVAKPQKQSTQESTTTKRVTRSRAKISGGLDVYRDSD